MARIFKIVLGILLVAVVVLAGVVVFLVRQPYPQTDGELEIDGLSAEVFVRRDEYGIPHIYAANETDLMIAQGYVTAQDRFWQMEFWRHIGTGRISEMVGSATVKSDTYIRTMGWNRIAENTTAFYREEEPELYALLEAYAAGVNAYIDANRGQLSLNHRILGLVNQPWEIEPWEPVHTISWAVVMADDLSGNFGSELERAKLLGLYGEEMVADLLPEYPYDRRPVIAPTELMVNELPTSCAPTSAAADVDWARVNFDVIERPENGFVFGSGPQVGSNNWVVHGDYTESGLPLLANDPHLGIQMPSIWYEIGLHAPGWDVAGFSFAGVPGIVIGHNSRIAWGVTNVGPDVQDLYIERINPDNPNQYEFSGEWRDMDVYEEVIKVNGGDDIIVTVRETHHGPIINDVVTAAAGKDVLALRWTAQERSRLLKSLLSLNKAANVDDFRAALEYWDVPSQNFVYADVDGNIAYQTPGLIPLRRNGNGRLPVPGWTGEYEWEGWIPYEDMPALLNPESGYIATANHAVVDKSYPCLLGLDWANGDRGQRIVEMLQDAMAKGDVSADTFAAIQFDNKSLLAESFIPVFDGLSSDDPDVQAAIERLRGWDMQEGIDSVPASIFEIFIYQLEYKVYADELGDEEWDAASSLALYELARSPDSAWWDDTSTAETEDAETIIMAALTDAVSWLKENAGDNIEDWAWGDLHTITFVSAPLGESGVGVIESLVNRGPFPAAGGRDIVNAASWSYDEPAVMNWHVSMRMIVDMADFDASRATLPTGQSGHPYHRHYDDMMPLWLNGEYHPFLFSEAAVQSAAVDTLTLRPAP